MLVLSKSCTANRSAQKVETYSTHALQPSDKLEIRSTLHKTLTSAEDRVVIGRSKTEVTGSSRDGLRSCLLSL